jgi:hypothetical protein
VRVTGAGGALTLRRAGCEPPCDGAGLAATANWDGPGTSVGMGWRATPAAASCASTESKLGAAEAESADAFQESEAHPASVAASALAVIRIFAPGTREDFLMGDVAGMKHLLP